MLNIFTQHPRSIQETYWEHLSFAARCGGLMVMAGLACITHAIFPFVFTTTASTMMYKLTDEMKAQTKQSQGKKL
jgi:hypothetical protein